MNGNVTLFLLTNYIVTLRNYRYLENIFALKRQPLPDTFLGTFLASGCGASPGL